MNFAKAFNLLNRGGKIRREFWSTSKCKYITKSDNFKIVDDKGNEIYEILGEDILSNDWVNALDSIRIVKYNIPSFYYYKKDFYQGIIYIHSYNQATGKYCICVIEQVNALEIDYKTLTKDDFVMIGIEEFEKEYPEKYEVSKKYWTKLNRIYNNSIDNEEVQDNFFEKVRKSINDVFNVKTVNNV